MSQRFWYRFNDGCERALREQMLKLNEQVIPLRTILSGKP